MRWMFVVKGEYDYLERRICLMKGKPIVMKGDMCCQRQFDAVRDRYVLWKAIMIVVGGRYVFATEEGYLCHKRRIGAIEG